MQKKISGEPEKGWGLEGFHSLAVQLPLGDCILGIFLCYWLLALPRQRIAIHHYCAFRPGLTPRTWLALPIMRGCCHRSHPTQTLDLSGGLRPGGPACTQHVAGDNQDGLKHVRSRPLLKGLLVRNPLRHTTEDAATSWVRPGSKLLVYGTVLQFFESSLFFEGGNQILLSVAFCPLLIPTVIRSRPRIVLA